MKAVEDVVKYFEENPNEPAYITVLDVEGNTKVHQHTPIEPRLTAILNLIDSSGRRPPSEKAW